MVCRESGCGSRRAGAGTIEVMSNPNHATPKVALIASALRDHAERLRAFVVARVPAAEVEDVLQTAAMRALERAETLREPERALPWLYRLHRNVIADALRKRASQQRSFERSGGAQPVDEAATDAAALVDADAPCGCSLVQARRIHPAYASMLALVDTGGLSLRDAAQALGISANNAAVRLHRARKALREAMREHCGVTSARDCADCRCVYEGCCAL